MIARAWRGEMLEWAEQRGYRVAWGPASLLERAQSELAERARDGEIDAAFAREQLSEFEATGREGERLVVVALARPAHLVGFQTEEARVDVVLPPTYERYRPTFEDVRWDLNEHALPGYRVTTAHAPVKLLASWLGLVRYGRNNITYASGIGSYLQLAAYVTDAPLPIDPNWTPSEPALLDECEACGICTAVCPTEAIGDDRVLLRAERCLTLATETAGPWPSHVPAGAHHCLIGCLLCQRHCPANPELPVVHSGVVFAEEETRALLAERDHVGPAWEGIRAKLEVLGQPYQEDVVGRNLRAVLSSCP